MQLAEWFVQRWRQFDGVVADGEGDPFSGEVGLVPGHPDDVFDLLAEHQHENGGEAVPGQQVVVRVVHHRLYGPILLRRRHFRAGASAVWCHPQVLEMRAAATAEAPRRSEDLGITPGRPIARRIRLVDPEASDDRASSNPDAADE